jgi:hypothetical protein
MRQRKYDTSPNFPQNAPSLTQLESCKFPLTTASACDAFHKPKCGMFVVSLPAFTRKELQANILWTPCSSTPHTIPNQINN